jgi:protein NrfC
MSPEKIQTAVYPISKGYILVDSKKCQGCLSCMMACSLVHEGEANLSLSRIQVMQNILKNWPDDIKVVQCRQCTDPSCIDACPSGALHIDLANGNIRVINEEECLGCQACLDACPFVPRRIIWNSKTDKAIKCDLCLNTPYWKEKGGPGGNQACIEACPQNAIIFTDKVPEQTGDTGYETNLREAKYGSGLHG